MGNHKGRHCTVFCHIGATYFTVLRETEISFSVSMGLPLLGLSFLIAAIRINWKFIALCIQEEGVGFMIVSVLCHSFFTIAVMASVLLEVTRRSEMIPSISDRESYWSSGRSYCSLPPLTVDSCDKHL